VTIFTIGHSTRSLETLVALLRQHGVRQVLDVRTVSKSRRNPQFDTAALAESLPRFGVRYSHLARLGGLRHARRDSPNTGWQNESFRGYADYMATPPFGQGIDELLELAAAAPTAIMCAEAVWWRCHRRLVSDALTVRGVDVRHIVGDGPAERHELTEFARVDRDGQLSYPGLL
jgi:uncharacterized protein (DUF488 family)